MDLQEPKTWTETRLCRKAPLFLINFICRNVLWNGWLAEFNWEKDRKRRYKVSLTWQNKKEPLTLRDGEGDLKIFHIYVSVSWKSLIRLWWFRLRNRKVKSDA
ncbi:MAG: hypothetical protein QQN63_11945 [Nitrosopumilus sp.]